MFLLHLNPLSLNECFCENCFGEVQFILAIELIFIRQPPAGLLGELQPFPHTIGLTGSRMVLQYVGNIMCSVVALPILL